MKYKAVIFDLFGTLVDQFFVQAVHIRASYKDSDEAHLPAAEEWHGPKISTLKEVLALV